jgi:acyl-CoA dehydrogenase
MIDLDPSPEVAELRERVAAFIQATVIPAEQRDDSEHGLDAGLRAELQDAARVAGLFAPHVSVSLGGLGLDTRGQAAVFEAAGYSLLGPQALNCAAPDEGNMHLLSVIATEQQRARYLVPLAAGAVRSCFAMTEPAPGAGSDPAMLATTATKVDGGWSISGRKWFITGAQGAAFAICMARTDESISAGRGATMFLSRALILRCAWTIDTGGHAGRDSSMAIARHALREHARFIEHRRANADHREPGGGC